MQKVFNRRATDAKPRRKRGLADVALRVFDSGRRNDVGGEFREGVLLAPGNQLWAGKNPSPLYSHVGKVDCIIAQEHVVWTNASGRVTAMTDVQTTRNWAVRPFIRETVCVQQDRPDADLAVSSRRSRGRPNPAVAALINLRPEALRQATVAPCLTAIVIAEAPPSDFYSAAALLTLRPLQYAGGRLSGQCIVSAHTDTSRGIPTSPTASLRLIGLRTEPKMIDADASSNVARVKQEHPVWDATMRCLPSDAVCQCKPSIDPDVSVSRCVDGPRPQPAFTGLVNSCPETRKELSGILNMHRDLPFVRNRGAKPRTVTSSGGAFSRPNYTRFQIGTTL